MNPWIVWKDVIETTLPNKKAFYSKLYLEDITDEDYIYASKAFEEFKLKNLGEYHDLYVQADTLLLAVYLKNLEINVLKYTNIILLIFYLHLDQHGKLVYKRQE